MKRARWSFGADHLGSYMRRWILRTPWFTIRLHRILESDEGRDHHCHPFDFTSVILAGGYVEHRPGCCCHQFRPGKPHGPCWVYGPGDVVRRQAEDFHRLELLNGPAWTFVLTGPYRRNWGFQLSDGSWVPHTEYHRTYYKQGLQ